MHLMSKTIQVEIKGNPFEVDAKEKAIRQLLTMDSDVLEKLANLSKNEKAIETFRNPPAYLKPFLGIK
jgi:hypothetical protein